MNDLAHSDSPKVDSELSLDVLSGAEKIKPIIKSKVSVTHNDTLVKFEKFQISVAMDSSEYPFTAKMDVGEFYNPLELVVTKKLADKVIEMGYEHITLLIGESSMLAPAHSNIKSDPSVRGFWRSSKSVKGFSLDQPSTLSIPLNQLIEQHSDDPSESDFGGSSSSPHLISIEPSMSFEGFSVDQLPTLTIPLHQSVQSPESEIALFCSPHSYFSDQENFQIPSADDFHLCKEGTDIYLLELSSSAVSAKLYHFSIWTTLFYRDFKITCFVKHNPKSKVSNIVKFYFLMEESSKSIKLDTDSKHEVVGYTFVKCSMLSANVKVFCEESEWLEINQVPCVVEPKSGGDLIELAMRKKKGVESKSKDVTFNIQNSEGKICQISGHGSFTLTEIKTLSDVEPAAQSQQTNVMPPLLIMNGKVAMKRHVMMSYAWGPYPDYKWKPTVTKFTEIMRSTYDLDIWRDEDGSDTEKRLQLFKSPTEAMTEAANKSEYAVVFVSKDYRDSRNCQTELEMLNKLRKDNFMREIYFIMLEKDFTPAATSKVRIEGTLQAAITDAFYYELVPGAADFDEKMMEATSGIAAKIKTHHESWLAKLMDANFTVIPSIYKTTPPALSASQIEPLPTLRPRLKSNALPSRTESNEGQSPTF